MKPIQVGSKVTYNNGCQEGAVSPVMVTRGGHQHNSAVIRVITRSRKASVQQPEPSRVITVVPTNMSGDQNAGTPQQLFVQTERGFQPLCPSLASVPRKQEADNHVEERNGFVEGNNTKFGPYAIYTASGSQITLRKLSVVESEKGSNFTTHPAKPAEVIQTPVSKPSYIKLPILRPAAPPVSSNVPTNHPSTFTR